VLALAHRLRSLANTATGKELVIPFRKFPGRLAASVVAVAAFASLGLISASTAGASVTIGAPFIAKVQFTGINGGDMSPLITVQGANFGAEPSGTPETACSGQFMGDSFGTSLYFWDYTVGWRAGQPADCIGIYIQRWTPNIIKFTFGSAFGTRRAYKMFNYDSYSLTIKGTTFSGLVRGLK
jgi:hypothetical protein